MSRRGSLPSNPQSARKDTPAFPPPTWPPLWPAASPQADGRGPGIAERHPGMAKRK